MLFEPAVFKQVNEDKLLLDFLGNSGFFLDVGANHPKIGSQTYPLETAGWDGLCVEPQPKYVALYPTMRKASIVQCACGTKEQEGQMLKLYCLEANASLDPDQVLYAVKDSIIESYDVPIRALDNILQERGISRIDFMTIDVEGFEMQVLKGISLNTYQPKLILLEDHLYNHECHFYLKNQGYKLVRRTELNMWYIPKNDSFRVSPWGHFQLFKKLYLSHPFRLSRKFFKTLKNKLNK